MRLGGFALVCAGSLIAVGVGGQGAQPTQKEKDDFLSRKKWYVSISVSITGSGQINSTSWRINRRYSIDVELDLVNPGMFPPSDPPKTTEELLETGRYIGWMTGPPDEEALARFEALGNPLALANNPLFAEGRFSIDDEFSGDPDTTTIKGSGLIYGTKTFQFNCDLKKLKFDANNDVTLATLKEADVVTTRRTGDPPPPYKINAAQLLSPAPPGIAQQLLQQTLRLSGPITLTASATYEVGTGLTQAGPDAAHLTYNVRIIISPSRSQAAQLVLRPDDKYNEYRPIPGEAEDKPGNSVKVEWELLQPGVAPKDKAKIMRVTFKLSDVSNYPGVCMNWPEHPSASPKPDFQFENRSDPNYRLGEQNLSVQLDGALVENDRGDVQVDCFDGAAIGTLTAEAELSDGRVIKGEVEGTAALKLLLPDRELAVSELAKHWRSKYASGLEDGEDRENDPEGDGQVGDGLSVWEEYRGFRQGGTWKDSCDPKKKDLFIENRAGAAAEPGISLFTRATGIVVHKSLKRLEHKPDRVINFNARGDRHIVDQHCLILRASDDPNKGTAQGIFGAYFPGPPKNTQWVNVLMGQGADVVYANAVQRTLTTRSYESSHIAHELGHAVGIYHHGDLDPWEDGQFGVKWTWPANGGSATVGGNAAKLISEATLEALVYPPGSVVRLGVGYKQGQHSGDVDCFMRYSVAHTYPYAVAPNTFVYAPQIQPPGNKLCSSRAGTDFNSGANHPHPRFFETDAKRGDCKHQFVVSDKWEAKDRR